MLLFYLLGAVVAGVLATVAAVQAGFPGWAVPACYVLGGTLALAICAIIDRGVERACARPSDPRTSQPGERRRGAILFLLVSLLALAGVLLASALGLVPVSSTERSPFRSGLMDPVLGLDHLLALLWLGLWAGRVRGPAFWALPAAFLAGTAAGYGLAFGPPVGLVLEATVHILVVASLLLLIGAALVPLRLPLPQTASTVGLMGGCHGYVHGLEASASPALWFGMGVLVSSAALASVGAALGRAVARPA